MGKRVAVSLAALHHHFDPDPSIKWLGSGFSCSQNKLAQQIFVVEFCLCTSEGIRHKFTCKKLPSTFFLFLSSPCVKSDRQQCFYFLGISDQTAETKTITRTNGRGDSNKYWVTICSLLDEASPLQLLYGDGARLLGPVQQVQVGLLRSGRALQRKYCRSKLNTRHSIKPTL